MDRCDVAEEAIFIESRHDELKEQESMIQVSSGSLYYYVYQYKYIIEILTHFILYFRACSIFPWSLEDKSLPVYF